MGTLLDRVEGMGVHILACKEVRMVVGMQACKVVEGKVEDMALHVVHMAEDMAYMAEHVVRMAEGMAYMVEGMAYMAERVVHMAEDMAHMAEDMVRRMTEDMPLGMAEGIARMVEDIPFCKVLGKQACMVWGSRWVGKVHKLEDMVRNNYRRNCWNSPSTRVPRHPKKATRLIFLVVFSLKTPCVKFLFFFVRISRKLSHNLSRSCLMRLSLKLRLIALR